MVAKGNKFDLSRKWQENQNFLINLYSMSAEMEVNVDFIVITQTKRLICINQNIITSIALDWYLFWSHGLIQMKERKQSSRVIEVKSQKNFMVINNNN